MDNQYNDEIYPNMPPLPQVMPGNTSDQLYAEYAQEKKVENILAQINPDNLLADIEARIKGYRKDVYSQQWVMPANNIPQISGLLIGNFMSFLGSILNNNTTLSNYKDQEINKIMQLVIAYVTDDLRANSVMYNLTNNYTERTRIGIIVCATVFSALKRAQNGLEAQRIFKAVRIGEQSNPYAEQRKDSFVDKLKFWR